MRRLASFTSSKTATLSTGGEIIVNVVQGVGEDGKENRLQEGERVG